VGLTPAGRVLGPEIAPCVVGLWRAGRSGGPHRLGPDRSSGMGDSPVHCRGHGCRMDRQRTSAALMIPSDSTMVSPHSASSTSVDVTHDRCHTTAVRVLATPRMRSILATLVEGSGPHEIVVLWPLAAECVPAARHDIGPRDVIIGHVSTCPIFVDLLDLKPLFDTDVLVLDVDSDSAAAAGTPHLLATSSSLSGPSSV
jgi:uncharacterized protein (DUF779 family)